jgi:hypothetical protein
MAAKTYTVQGLNRALRSLPREASARLRDASVKIAAHVADDARTRALRQAHGPGRLVAPSIKATRDRVPVVRQGSTRRLPPRNGKQRQGSRQTIGDLMFGAEFGGGARASTQQFLPWRGSSERAGYFLYPAVRANSAATGAAYSEALDDALQAI